MSTNNKPAKISLPSLVTDLGLAAKFDNFNSVLNATPPATWLKVHKGNQYQPVERVKNNIITLFQDYDWDIKDVRIVANSILVFGTLGIINPITGRYRKIDGVGAWPIQLDAGAKPLEIERIKQDAIQKNAPAAESMAFKNAAKKLGSLFGDGVPDEVEFNGIYSAANEKVNEPIDPSTLDTELKVNQAVASGKITKEAGVKRKAELKGELAI